MTEPLPTLDSLRREIDRIDNAIHDLLMERAGIVDSIGRVKASGGAPTVHPAREAAILRRLLQRHQSSLPFRAIAAIWREIISAFTTLQTPFSVTVHVPETAPTMIEQQQTWSLARDYFGAMTPLIVHQTPSQVLRALTEHQAAFAVLPQITEDDSDPWWRQLATHDPAAPRIVAKLPVTIGATTGPEAYVLSSQHLAVETFERSYIAIELPTDTSRTRLRASFTAAGLDCLALNFWGREGLSMALAVFAGAVPLDDPRLAEVSGGLAEPLSRLYHLGGHPEPLVLA
jgi:chorismate mutase / prephenate dehydratase